MYLFFQIQTRRIIKGQTSAEKKHKSCLFLPWKSVFFQQGNPPARSTEVTIHERSFQIQHAKVPKNHQVSLVASLWASCASFPTMVLVGKKKARNLKRHLTHHGSQQNSTSPLFQEEAEVFKKIERYQCLQSLRFAGKFFCEEIRIWPQYGMVPVRPVSCKGQDKHLLTQMTVWPVFTGNVDASFFTT